MHNRRRSDVDGEDWRDGDEVEDGNPDDALEELTEVEMRRSPQLSKTQAFTKVYLAD